MLSQKEKLEEELKLLRESLELNVITKEEFENAKQRIEAKINELNALEQKKVEEVKVGEEKEIKEEQKPEEKPEVKEEPKPEVKKEEEKIEIKEVELKKDVEEKEEIKEEPLKEEVKLEEEKEAEKKKEEELIKEGEEQKKLEVEEDAQKSKISGTPFVGEPKEEVKVEEEKPVEEKPQVTIIEEEKKDGKKIFTYIAIIVILGFVSWYFFFSGSDSPDFEVLDDKALGLIACSSDNDCIKEGSIGICNNPGEENSECEYIQDVEVELIVLNDKNCFNCDIGRVLSILNGFFPNIDMENIDFETERGKEIAERFDIDVLPAYILNSSIKEAYNYNKFSSSFNEVDENFVMKNTVANANYYTEREEIANKLDLFVKQDQNASSKAEENLKEFLEAFNGKIVFEKHNSDDKIVEELGINSFPAFLVNNKIKFGGVRSADKIKDNFCSMNKLDECELELSKSLV